MAEGQATGAQLGIAEAIDRGMRYRRERRYDEARQALQRALELDPRAPAAHLNLGRVHYDEGRFPAALGCFEKAVELDPGCCQALHNLGKLYYAEGSMDEAIDVLRRAVALEPERVAAQNDLGLALLERGDRAAALTCFESALAAEPGDSTAGHFAAVARAAAPAQASPRYVRELFDAYAEKFDSHVIDHLEYRTPALLFHELESLHGAGEPLDSALDMGCGTGLMGPFLRQLARAVSGIDLSPGMLEKAGKLGVYDRLECRDLVEFLSGADPASSDLVVAADVFVYIGDLDRVFAGVSRILRATGMFAFSIETAGWDVDRYALARSGRYQHAVRYIATLREAYGLTELHASETTLRKERDTPTTGTLFVLGKPAAPG
jgi:predicted TPR repeat methyltransferase